MVTRAPPRRRRRDREDVRRRRRGQRGDEGGRRLGVRRRPAPRRTATVVRVAGGEVLTTDGPFAETKEQLGGFWVIKADRPRRRPGLGGQGAPWPARPRRGPALPGRARGLSPCRPPTADAAEIERVFRQEYGRAVATLVRLFGDIDVAEEAVQDAFVVALAALAVDRPAAQPRAAGSSPPPATGPSTGCAGRRPDRTATRQAACLVHGQDDDPHGGGAPCATTACG